MNERDNTIIMKKILNSYIKTCSGFLLLLKAAKATFPVFPGLLRKIIYRILLIPGPETILRQLASCCIFRSLPISARMDLVS